MAGGRGQGARSSGRLGWMVVTASGMKALGGWGLRPSLQVERDVKVPVARRAKEEEEEEATAAEEEQQEVWDK